MGVGRPWRRPSDRELLAGKGLFRDDLKHWRHDIGYVMPKMLSNHDAYIHDIPLAHARDASRIENGVIECLRSRGITPLYLGQISGKVRVVITAQDFNRAKTQNEEAGANLSNRGMLDKDRRGIITPHTLELLRSVSDDLGKGGMGIVDRLMLRPFEDDQGHRREMPEDERKHLATAMHTLLDKLGKLQIKERMPEFAGKTPTKPGEQSKQNQHRAIVMRELRTDAMETIGPDIMRKVGNCFSMHGTRYTVAHETPQHEQKPVWRHADGTDPHRTQISRTAMRQFARRELRDGFDPDSLPVMR